VAIDDIDALETREWLDALDAIFEHDGPQRAEFLLERLAGRAGRSGAAAPIGATPYVNTIPPSREPPLPGDPEPEARIAALIRWNAMTGSSWR
jgi:pyruvate dehydrogenase E1 component